MDPTMERDATTRGGDEELRALVRGHRVTYDVYPAKEVVSGATRVVGYDIELVGTHARGTGGVAPGCEKCAELWRDLERLAHAAIPDGTGRTSRCEVRRFDHVLQIGDVDSKHADYRVRLVLEIRSGTDGLAPLDDCDDRCRDDIVARLRALGAREHAWGRSAAP